MRQALWMVSSPGSKRKGDSADGISKSYVGESALELTREGKRSENRNVAMLKGTSETLHMRQDTHHHHQFT